MLIRPAYLVLSLVSLSACGLTRNDLRHKSYAVEAPSFEKLVNCFIRNTEDNEGWQESTNVKRLEEPTEIRVAHKIGTNIGWEADFIKNDNHITLNAYSMTLSWDRGFQRWFNEPITSCGGKVVGELDAKS